MSNRGQRPRTRALPQILCLEGSTPEDRLYKTATCKAERFISVYRLGEDGDLLKEGGGMLSVWTLRARSYKTRAEA